MRCLTALALLALLPVAPGHARQVVLTSKQPYQQVGELDRDLSRACSLGRFGPARLGALVARLDGAVLDVAKGNGVNLTDRDRRAKPKEDYFFRNAGTTSCTVFVGGRKGNRQSAAR
jgi:hypothetical protein